MTNRCKLCGKEIPKGISFCNNTCFIEYTERHPKKTKKDRQEAFRKALPETSKILNALEVGNENNGKKLNTPFFMKGDGMVRRSNNIDEIKKMILNGASYRDIMILSRKYFCSKRVDEYYDIAMSEIGMEQKVEGESKNVLVS